ncbi:uncharacterized protein LOC108836624 [Raphanus sativus]|uniref:Uncharacterized protein LOC108836624 n=1 Tax=Raphanus sativus TaxID=3726 RepID=A0A6J0LZQ2_RAPSA|nr:uncharacterized protein LOC108836624 [Raphanus sativus]
MAPGSSSQPSPAFSQPSSASSSRRRAHRRSTRAASPEPLSPEIESLSDTDSDNDDTPLDATEIRVNQAKEQRFEESRSTYRTKSQLYPELMAPHTTPLDQRFFTAAAAERFRSLRRRKFITQHRISLIDVNMQDVRNVVRGAGLLHTLTDVDAYQPTMVKEFIANLQDAEERDVGVAVYCRGYMIDFSSSLINDIYCVPGFEDDPNWLGENIDEVCGFLTDGRINRWENMSSKFLTRTNQVLYKLVCTNWMPTMNYTNMNQDRLKFVYMLHHNEDGFNFGKLVYDQIMAMGARTKSKRAWRIMFPTLIQQVINYQQRFPVEESTGFPKLVVKDIKAGRGNGADARPPNLEEDLSRMITGLNAIRIRLRRGEYVLPHQQTEPAEDEPAEDGGNDTEELSHCDGDETEELSDTF